MNSVEVEEPYTTTADTAGRAVIAVSPTTNLRPWRVTQVSIECTAAPTTATCALRKNGTLISPLAAAADAAAGDPAVTLQTTDTMTIEWAGLPAGAACTAYVFRVEG